MPTEEKVTRKLRAILSADVKGYSLLMANDEAYTIKKLEAYRDSMSDIIRSHSGRVVDAVGDNLLAEFSSIVDAVRCSVEIQKDLQQKNANLPTDKRLEFRIGVNIGDVIQEGNRIYGNGVNVAARIEGLADPGGVCISRNAYSHVRDKLELGYEYLGEHIVKNIKRPIRVYKVLMKPEDAGKLIGEKRQRYRKKWSGFGVVTVAFLIGIIVWQFYYEKSPTIEAASVQNMAFPLPDRPSIAVLPFDNMSGDPKQEFFCDGLSEDIITAISKIPDIFVIARNSSFTYKGTAVKIKQVAEELGVRYVLEGSVRTSENKVRITAQLIDAIKGDHLWAERYDRTLEDVFSLQDEITLKVLTALQVKLTEGEKIRALSRGTNNLNAYLKWVEGRQHFLRLNKDDNTQARKLLEEAIELDPNFPSPYTDLAWTHIFGIRFGQSKSPKESIKIATDLGEKAIGLDETSAFAHSLLGALSLAKRQYEEAIAQGEKAVSLSPGHSIAIGQLGRTLAYTGKYEESITWLEKAIRLDPKALNWMLTMLGHCYLFMGKTDEAIDEFKKVLHHNPKDMTARVRLAAAYSLSDKDQEASSEATEILKQNPKFSIESVKKWGIKSKEDLELLMNALFKAGLPDKSTSSLFEKPSIAVLPFVNISNDPGQEYFSDGLTEEIITALSKVPDMLVISRNSTFTYKDKPVKVQQVAEDLGVKYVLEGSVRKDKEKVRITAQLIDAVSGHHLWADRYDRDIEDVFAVQDDITITILNALEVKLTEGEQARLLKKGTNNLQVYLKLLQGLHHTYSVNPESNLRARAIYEEIISQEPNYASAYMLLARSYWLEAFLGTSKSKEETLQKGTSAAEKAISIDNSMGMSYAVLGQISILKKDWDKGIAMLNKAIELEPNAADPSYYLGLGLNFAGRPEEAIPMLTKAIRLNPITPGRYLNAIAISYRMVGQYDKAIEYLEKATKRYPNFLFAHLNLSACYILAGRDKEAYAEAKEVLRLNPKFTVDRFAKALQLRNQEEKDRFIGALRKAFSVQGNSEL